MNGENQPSRHGSVVFESGDSGTSKDLISLNDEETFVITDYTFTYDDAATADAEVELYDAPEGTAEGSLTSAQQFDTVHLNSGDYESSVGINRDPVESDLVVVVRDNDDDVTVTVGGKLVTG